MLSKKVLLTIAPVFWPKLPPLGIAFLQAYALREGIAVDILDLNNLFYNLANPELKKTWLISCNTRLEHNIFNIMEKDYMREYQEAIEKILSYDVVGFSCFKSNLKTTVEMVKVLKQRKRDLEIILGGPEIARQFFKTNGDFNGELKELADMLVAGEGFSPFLNYFKKERGLKKVSNFIELEDLDQMPFPRYEGMDLSLYPRRRTLSLWFSSGCLRKCRFCSERLLYRRFKTRCVKDVIEEIRFHREKNETEYFVFHDSMINGDLEKLENLCDAIMENFGSVLWEAQLAIRPDTDLRIFDKMKKSGCYHLFIGLESGCERTLRKMNKGFTCIQAVDFLRKLQSVGLSFGISLIVGYPGETENDFRESLDFIIAHKDLIPKIEQVNPFVYYDGIDMDRSHNGILNQDVLKRTKIFVSAIKKHRIKHTEAFIGNLLEKNG